MDVQIKDMQIEITDTEKLKEQAADQKDRLATYAEKLKAEKSE